MLDSVGSLRRDVARAAFASGGVEMIGRVLAILLSIATARALEPGEVGLLGLAVIVVGALSLVTACAETAGVIGREEGSDSQYAIAAVVVRGVVTAVLLCAALSSLPALARVLAGQEAADAELVRLVQLLLWQLLFDMAATYPRVVLQRRLRLMPLAGASLLQITGHLGLSLLLLREGYGAMGVVVSSLVSGGLSAAFLWCQVYRAGPAWGGGVAAMPWRQTLMSTGRVFAAGFVGYLNGRLSNLLVAGVLGPAAMSFYGLAWNASRVPVWILSQALGPVLVPTISHVRSDAPRVKRILREALRHAYVLLVPACVLLFVAAESLVTAILGSKWLPCVPALRVMSVSVLLAPVVVVFNALLVATDRAHWTGLATAAQLATIAVFVVPLAVRWGVVGAAIGDLVSTAVLVAIFFALCRVKVPEVGWEVLQAASLPLLAALPAGFLAWHLAPAFPAGVITLAGEACLVLIGYLGAISLLGGRRRVLELAALVRDLARRSPPVAMAARAVERR